MSMYRWIKKRSNAYWIAICLTAILCYGFLILNFSIGIDDLLIKSYVAGKAMFHHNRIGQYLTNLVFNVAEPLPFWAEFIGVILMIFAVTMVTDLMDYASKGQLKEKSLIVFACVTISFPFLAKATIFTGLTMTIGYIWFGAAVAGKQMLKYIECRKKVNLLNTVFWGTFTLLFDKAYISLNILLFLMAYFLCIVYKKFTKEICSVFRHGLISVGLWIVELVISIFLTIILQYFNNIPKGKYTQSYVLYTKENFFKQIRHLFINGIELLKDDAFKDFGVMLYLIAICILIFSLLIYCIKKGNGIIIVFLGIAIVLCTNMVHLATGNLNMPRRAFCFLFASFTGFSLMLGNELILAKFNKELMHFIINILLVILIIDSSKAMMEIYMNDYIKYNLDKTKMDEIVNDICEYTGGIEKPIIFIGIPDNYDLDGDIECWSNFVADRASSDNEELRSKRLYDFFEYHGYKIREWDSKKIDEKEVRERCANMAIWPKEGSIEETDEYILVKLGNSRCEIINASYSSMLDEYQDGSCEFECSIGHMLYDAETRTFDLYGWILMKGHNDYSSDIKLGLLSREGDIQYICYLENESNPGITDYWRDGFNHDNSQFRIIYTNLSNNISNGEYELILLINNMYGKYYYKIGESIRIE